MNAARIGLFARLLNSLRAAVAGESLVTLRYAFKSGGTFLVKSESDWRINNESSGSHSLGTVKTIDRLRADATAGGNFTLTRECLSCDASIGDAIDVNDLGIMNKGQKAVTEMSATGEVVRYVSKPFDICQEVLCIGLPVASLAVGGSCPFSGEMTIPHIGKMEMKGDWKLVEIRPAGTSRYAYLEYLGFMHDQGCDSNITNTFKFVFDLDAGIPVEFKIRKEVNFKWQGRTIVRSNITCDATTEELGTLEDVKLLTELLDNEEDVRVRATLVRVLGEVGGPSVVPVLALYLHDPDDRVRANAVEALERNGGPGIEDQLAPFVHDKSNRVKANAARALFNLGDGYAVNILNEMILSRDERMRASAAFVFGEIQSEAAIPYLVRALSDQVWFVVKNVVKSLAKKGEAAVPKLAECLRSQAKTTVINAMEALAEIGSPDCLTDLIPLLHHVDNDIRERAEEVVDRIRECTRKAS